ncbi:hypothetical protein QCA50_020458 [Cerrena zonata]|uniref:Uncharacterized protein n=1 Tax=Cerrena zonata TaxID=2478898 RepID=A0AAW0FAD5_9APHY
MVITSYVTDVFCRMVYATFDCLRIWGITQHQWLPTLIVFTLSIFDSAANIYTYSNSPEYTIVSSVGIITRTISVAAYAAVLIFTISAIWSVLRVNLELKTQTTLTSLLLYNGSIQFGTLLLLNIIAIILDVFSIAPLTGGNSPHSSSFTYVEK